MLTKEETCILSCILSYIFLETCRKFVRILAVCFYQNNSYEITINSYHAGKCNETKM